MGTVISTSRRHGWVVVVGMALASVVAPDAGAQEICVECSEPAVSYSCSIAQSEKIRHFKNSERVIRYGCVKVLARLGKHASCRASQGTKGPCLGKPVQLSAADLLAVPEPTEKTLPAQVTRPDDGEAGGQNANEGGAKPQKQAGPPRTMKELAETTFSNDTLKSAGDSVKGAGDAVGGAVKKTWDCLTTLFSQC